MLEKGWSERDLLHMGETGPKIIYILIILLGSSLQFIFEGNTFEVVPV